MVFLERSAPPVAKADDLVAVPVDPAADDRTDGGVEPGTVTATCEHADAHDSKILGAEVGA